MDYVILEILNEIVQVIDMVPIKIKCVHASDLQMLCIQPTEVHASEVQKVKYTNFFF